MVDENDVNAARVASWLGDAAEGLTVGGLLDRLERASGALWARARPVLGEAALAAVAGRVVCDAAERFAPLAAVEVRPAGLRVDALRARAAALRIDDLTAAVRALLIDLLALLGHLTAEALTPALHAALAAAPGPPPPAPGRRQFEHLGEAGRLLLRADRVEQSAPPVFALLAQTLALRSAVLIYDDGRELRCRAWRAESAPLLELRLAEMHARRCYAYLTGLDAGAAPSARGVSPPATVATLPGPGPEPTAPCIAAPGESLLTLPLAAGAGRVFGTLQLAVGGRLDEAGLLFAGAVAGQLAAALDRQSALRAERARAEEQRRECERRCAVAEAARAQAEQARARAEMTRDLCEAELDFSRAVTNSLGEGVVAVDVAGRITFFNPAAERLLGWSATEAIGVQVQGLLRLRQLEDALVGPDECPLLHVLRTGEPVRSDDALFLGRDGAPYPVSYTSSPIRRWGHLTGAVLVFRDVMDLKRSENAKHFLAEVSAALASSLDREQTLRAAARVAVPFLADVCLIEELNDDGTTSRTASADDGRGLVRSCPFSLEARWQEARAAVVKTGRAWLVHDLSSSASDGAAGPPRRLTSLMVVPLRARGRPIGLLSLGSLGSGRHYAAADLTFAEELANRAALALDNARLYQEMQKAVRQRQDMLAVVSHDLRTPLGTVLMGATLLSDQCDDDDGAARRKTLEMITRSVAQMDRLIKDLLDMSSIDAGRLAIDRHPHALGPLVEDTLETLRPLAARRSLRLEGNVRDGAAAVVCDRWRVMQVLSNLVGNAIKFTPEGGAVEVRAFVRAQEAHFEVVDTGVGIAGERLPHVFERYWRAEETAAQGCGLGLYICKGIVEAHGGRIGVRSEVGRGSTFFFSLPLRPPEDAPALAGAPPPPPQADEPSPHPSERPPPPPSLSWLPNHLPQRR
ncbi:MAG TPA: ATP-binding protein [Polyangiaceae bacterium]|nr:ATP-binding protein [Polyangiaceae bacterium]